jgi:hydrogenase maturation protease
VKKESKIKKMRVMIGGIGNVLLGDDGVGPYVARLLAAHYEFADGVEVLDLGTPALDLIDHLTSNEAVILIDSISSDDTKIAPGAVVLFRKADIMSRTPSIRMDPHSPALVDALLSSELFGVAPADVLLVGIKADTFDVGCELSSPVKASLDEVIVQVLHELDRLGVEYLHRQQPADLGIWWATTGANEETTGAPLLN